MSRRDQIRMTEEEQGEYLRAAQTIIINTIGTDGVPHPMPMWFGLEEDGAVVMTTFTKSQKIKNIERDPRVSLLVEDGTIYAELSGLLIYGTAELVRETDGVLDILTLVTGRQGNIPADAAPDAVRAGLQSTAAKRTGIRIRADNVVSWNHRKLAGKY